MYWGASSGKATVAASSAATLLSQNFTADLTLRRANVAVGARQRGAGSQFITINKIIGNVDAIVASKEFETKPYKELDVTALRLELATGCKAIVRLETEDGAGKAAFFEVVGLREKNKNVEMSVKAIKGGDIPLMVGLLKKAKVSIGIIGALQMWQTLAPLQKLPEIEARYNSKTKTVTLKNNDGRVARIIFIAMQTGMQTGVQLDFWRSGSKNTIVANVESIKADIGGFQLQLNNKGLTSDGRAAKEATKGVGLLKSGTYTVGINTIPDLGEDGESPDIVSLDVKGELKKTNDLGSFRLLLSSENGSRILYTERDEEDEDSGDASVEEEEAKMTEIKSMSVRKYLRGLADMLKGASDAGYLAPYSFVQLRLEDGRNVMGEIRSLKDNNGDWIGSIKLAFNDTAGFKNTTNVVGALFWGGIVAGPPGQRL